MSTQLPGTELSGNLTLGKVRGIERRLSVLPHQLEGRGTVEHENHACVQASHELLTSSLQLIGRGHCCGLLTSPQWVPVSAT